MECPDCKDCQLESVLTRQGLLVDYCRNCHGVWLDRGDIYLLSLRNEIASKRLKESEKTSKNKISPKTNISMTPINYPEGIEIYICDSGGIWIEGKQVNKFRCSEEDHTMLDLGILSSRDDMQPELSNAAGFPGTIAAYEKSPLIPSQWITKAKKVSILVFLSIGILWVWVFASQRLSNL